MKLWVDDNRPAPDGYLWCKSVNETKESIEFVEHMFGAFSLWYPTTGKTVQITIEMIDIDRDSGDYNKLLDWLEETGRNYPIRIHNQEMIELPSWSLYNKDRTID